MTASWTGESVDSLPNLRYNSLPLLSLGSAGVCLCVDGGREEEGEDHDEGHIKDTETDRYKELSHVYFLFSPHKVM